MKHFLNRVTITYSLTDSKSNNPLTDILKHVKQHQYDSDVDKNDLIGGVHKKYLIAFLDEIESDIIKIPGGSFILMNKENTIINFHNIEIEELN